MCIRDRYSGAEVFLNHEYLDMIDSKAFNTLADSKYLLVEFDVRRNMNHNDYAEDYLYELKVRGYRPIIAHVERYFPKGIDLERVQSWIELGCYIQVNRTSLLGTHGDAVSYTHLDVYKRQVEISVIWILI